MRNDQAMQLQLSMFYALVCHPRAGDRDILRGSLHRISDADDEVSTLALHAGYALIVAIILALRNAVHIYA